MKRGLKRKAKDPSRWALVTGASQGIGEAVCERLSRSGWSIVLVSRNLNKLEQVAQKLEGRSLCVATDLASPVAITKLASRLQRELPGGLKALVNNAGIYKRAAFMDTAEEQWGDEIAVNLLGPVRLIRALHPLMMKAKPAAIVNISSTLGLKPVAMTSSYSATKAALNNLTQTLAAEWAPDIRVNGICPGLIDTPIHDFHDLSEKSEARRQAHRAQPMGRMGQPRDIAATVDFLLSEDSDWTTGALWTVDGGIQLS